MLSAPFFSSKNCIVWDTTMKINSVPSQKHDTSVAASFREKILFHEAAMWLQIILGSRWTCGQVSWWQVNVVTWGYIEIVSYKLNPSSSDRSCFDPNSFLKYRVYQFNWPSIIYNTKSLPVAKVNCLNLGKGLHGTFPVGLPRLLSGQISGIRLFPYAVWTADISNIFNVNSQESSQTGA